MKASNIIAIRKDMQLSQIEFGLIFGVHYKTISRWEAGKFNPTPYQEAFLEMCDRALEGSEPIGELFIKDVAKYGVCCALYNLMAQVY